MWRVWVMDPPRTHLVLTTMVTSTASRWLLLLLANPIKAIKYSRYNMYKILNFVHDVELLPIAVMVQSNNDSLEVIT